MSLALAFALVLSTPAPSVAQTASGLVGTARMTVRVLVADRCQVSPIAVACEGTAPIRPLGITRSPTSRVEITF
jgi:hypothetical protein